MIVGDYNASSRRVPKMVQLIDEQGWTDCGHQAAIWGGVPCQPTCRAGTHTKQSRIDYVLVNTPLLPAVKGFQTDTCDDFHKHQPNQLKIDVGELKQEADRYRKTTSASKKIQDVIYEAIKKDPDVAPEKSVCA